MNKLLTLTLIAGFAAMTLTAGAQEEKKPKAGPKCPVSGKPIDKAHAVAHNGGQVYFCCPNCPGAFEKDPSKFTVKANHQLAQTKQAKQAKCPLTGGPTTAEQTVGVAGVKVAFCCGKCQGKAAGLKGDARMELIFSDEAFKKGFQVGSKD